MGNINDIEKALDVPIFEKAMNNIGYYLVFSENEQFVFSGNGILVWYERDRSRFTTYQICRTVTLNNTAKANNTSEVSDA